MGFAGVRRRGSALSIDPHVPPTWPRLAFPLHFRGSRLHLMFENQALRIRIEGAPLRLLLGGAEHTLQPGEHAFSRRPNGEWLAR
jgi:trehalose/maltose hydrolase-like predicted phosphorylase